MQTSLKATLVSAAAVASLAIAPAAPADGGWHPVKEQWQPYPEAPLTLPSDRYCGDFVLKLTPVRQDIKVKVLSRWASGEPRSEIYAGPLHSRATNETTGKAKTLNLSGTAHVLYRSDGTVQRYAMGGPVGMGWPTGSGNQLPQGYYRFTGHHVVEFAPDGTRSVAVDHGPETDVCALVR